MAADSDLPAEVAAAADRLDDLVKSFEAHPDPAVQERVFELLRCVDALHRSGLRRLNALLKVAGLQQRAVDDPEVRLLFDLYDLGEGGEEERAAAVVDSLRPALENVGARVELIGADTESVRVRLHAPAQTCGDLRGSVEEALRHGLPGVQEVQVETETGGSAGFIPLARLLSSRTTWRPVVPLRELALGQPRPMTVGEDRLLLVHLADGEVYAYRNACPGSPFPLEAGEVSADTLRCPWHGCLFDLRGGRRLDAQAPGLAVVPVRIDEGVVRVQLAAEVAA